jgi:hypothetical protein
VRQGIRERELLAVLGVDAHEPPVVGGPREGQPLRERESAGVLRREEEASAGVDVAPPLALLVERRKQRRAGVIAGSDERLGGRGRRGRWRRLGGGRPAQHGPGDDRHRGGQPGEEQPLRDPLVHGQDEDNRG